MENKKCTLCLNDFIVEDDEIKFLDDVSPEINGQKFNIPTPANCPTCRSRNRYAYRNMRNLSKIQDPNSDNQMFTHFDETVKFPVYSTEYWWSDAWDGLQYGRDYDFSRKFFDQFKDLYEIAPAPGRYILNVEDCDYTNGNDNSKHCFLAFGISRCENCFYGTDLQDSRTCLDCLAIQNCELCYECVRCMDCYDIKYSIRSNNCRESYFLSDCRSCSSRIGCVNLSNKQYYIFNEQKTKEEFEAKAKQLENHDNIAKFREEFNKFQLGFPKRYYYGVKTENCTGDDISNAKNAKNTFYASEVEDIKHCTFMFRAKNCMDYDIYGDNSQWIYQGLAQGENCSRNIFCMQTWANCNDNMYCNLIVGCKNCFGCSGLKHKQYCIFNKQFTKEEYESLVPKIIEKMKQDNEWGQFYPFSMSPFALNETTAQEYYPLSKEQINELGGRWKEPTDLVPTNLETVDSSTLPKTIDEVSEDICSKVIKCKESGRLYQIQKGELAFYQSKKIPLPQFHSEVRHAKRVEQRNPYLLWKRDCSCQGECEQHQNQCPNKFETSYSPDRPEKVFCETCYQNVIK
jgi:hypothetical protein